MSNSQSRPFRSRTCTARQRPRADILGGYDDVDHRLPGAVLSMALVIGRSLRVTVCVTHDHLGLVDGTYNGGQYPAFVTKCLGYWMGVFECNASIFSRSTIRCRPGAALVPRARSSAVVARCGCRTWSVRQPDADRTARVSG